MKRQTVLFTLATARLIRASSNASVSSLMAP
jgi:hypothetical protein